MYGYVIADVFTETALEGNPLAVVPDAAGLTAGCMQRIAREMNLSETTFVLPPLVGGDVRVRIFTPVGELPFAGHPTFGTAAVLAATGHKSVHRGTLRMETGMGVVPFKFVGKTRGRTGDQRALTARMLQPIPVWEPYARAKELLAALGVARSTLPVEVYRNGPRHAFVGLESVEQLSALRVDLRALAEHEDLAANCFAPTADPLVWRARMFSPAYGVTEDAGTGSAAGPLALHLGRHGMAPLGGAITVRQGVEMGRPSTIRAQVTMAGDRVEQVEIAGSAVVVADGRLYV
ncbi:PhzF family phenazine biosynthesis protein [Dactylosporangium sp. CS-033363]|uniref:PhzF family phenazine biosynthesis protein n=1 Tax=Dactylosporangium sp. CS-033363 TaxID=3239935 RepID=UPI003D8B3B2C